MAPLPIDADIARLTSEDHILILLTPNSRTVMTDRVGRMYNYLLTPAATSILATELEVLGLNSRETAKIILSGATVYQATRGEFENVTERELQRLENHK